MAPKIGDLVKLKGELCVRFGGSPLGIIEEVHIGTPFDKEYKIRWANPQLIVNEPIKTTPFSWIKSTDFEIISED